MAGHLAATIDCHGREIVSFEFAPRGLARDAEQAFEEVCIGRFGTLRPTAPPPPVVQSDNGLIFQSRRPGVACRDYRFSQEFITPHTPA